MTKKLMRELDEIIKDERDCGHFMMKPEISYDEKLGIMAECIGVDCDEDDEGHTIFKSEKDKIKVEEALDYYEGSLYW